MCGIHRMFLWLIPHGYDLGGTIGIKILPLFWNHLNKKICPINHKKVLFPTVLFIALCFFTLTARCMVKPTQKYGVFLGIDAEQMDRLENYRLVVIEPSEFSREQLKALHDAGKTVYGYLNIGAIEKYRSYYDRFQDITLGSYEDWPYERWVDVTSPAWQSFIVDELGNEYAAMGFDGFFLDNADVFFHYPTDDIFRGLCIILKGLKSYDRQLILNGGDLFVSRCIEENTALSLFDGINQETVFTRINFKDKTYEEQAEADIDYFQGYLSNAKKYGLSVYLLEYGANQVLSKKIDVYCSERGFLWYNAEGLELR